MDTRLAAPAFAQQLSELIRERGKTQRQVAGETGVSVSVVNRLCTNGIGSEESICIIVHHLGLKRRRMLEMLTDRRAELSEGHAKEAWANFRYAFLEVDEYLSEICPLPLERAYACTHRGIRLGEVVDLARQQGISRIQNMRDIDPWKFVDFVGAFEKRFGKEAREEILAKVCGHFPPMLVLDLETQVDPAAYLSLRNCRGRLIFGLPHLVIGEYTFLSGGVIMAHRNTGGVEFLYSLEGTFELTYEAKVYPIKLAPLGSVFIFDARRKHSIALREGPEGRLLMVRYYPQKREVVPGRPRRRQASRIDEIRL